MSSPMIYTGETIKERMPTKPILVVLDLIFILNGKMILELLNSFFINTTIQVTGRYQKRSKQLELRI